LGITKQEAEGQIPYKILWSW